MTTAQDVIAVARGEVGYVETGGDGGHSGNITKYWAELDPPLEGQSWCAVFVSWVFKHAGAPLPVMDRPYGYMNCASAVAYAKARGLFDDSGHYAPGDIVLYGPGGGQHTGIVVSDDGVTLHTIEGNTTPDQVGTQWNGGGVYERVRPHDSWVYGAMKTSRLLSPPPAPPKPPATPPPAPPRAPAPEGLTVKIIDLRNAATTVVTGPNVAPMQRLLGVAADGKAGPMTRGALGAAQIRIFGVADYEFGPATAEALLAGK